MITKKHIIEALQMEVDVIKVRKDTGFQWNDLTLEERDAEIHKMKCLEEAIKYII
jgi:hypothetical protein